MSQPCQRLVVDRPRPEGTHARQTRTNRTGACPRIAPSLTLAVALAGCGNGLAQRQAELTRWIGHPETELVQAMGAPTRSYETDGLKVLTYEDSRVDIIPGTPFYQGYGPYWWGSGPGLPPQAVNRTCDTNFTIQAGVVKGFSLRGDACG